MPKEKFNIVEFALNGKEAAKHMCFTILWVLLGALWLTGVGLVVAAYVILIMSFQCSSVAGGYMCTIAFAPPF